MSDMKQVNLKLLQFLYEVRIKAYWRCTGFIPLANVVSDSWRRMSTRTTCLGVYYQRMQSRVEVTEFGAFEEDATGPSAPVAVRHAGRRKAKLKFTSSLLLSL